MDWNYDRSTMNLLSPAGFWSLVCKIMLNVGLCGGRWKTIMVFAGHPSLAIAEVMKCKPGALVVIALDCRSMSTMPFARNIRVACSL